jgi:diguanylate cyclase (GGDEF)-like protein
MTFRKIIYKLFYAFLILGAIASISVSVLFSQPIKADWQLALLAFVTIFLSAKLHFQLPKTKIHFSIADVLILFALLKYGAVVSIWLALFESLFTTYSFKRSGISTKPKTFVINASIHVISVFATFCAIYSLFFTDEHTFNNSNYDSLVLLVLIMSFTQYLTNSTLVAIAVSENNGSSFRATWVETYLNLALLYLVESLLAVLAYTLVTRSNLFMVIVVFGFAAIVYATYRRYINEIKQTSAQAEEAERERAESEKLRAEQAEKHIFDLKKLLDEQERISEELLRSKNEFRQAAFHDNLTDLPNRNFVVEQLSGLLDVIQVSPNYKFAVLYIDLNGFKKINDSLGYSFGNEIIKKVGKRLLDTVESGNIVTRFSSDEFAVVITESTSEEIATRTANKIIENFSAPFILEERQVFTVPTIGIAISNEDYKTVEDILRDAEIAMYHAKQTQKSFAVFNRSMHDSVIERIEIESDLRLAIQGNEFSLHFQPIVDLRTLQISGFEALVRWNHPRKGYIPPNSFISVAEDTGLIIPMTGWILREACRKVKEWQIAFNPDLNISVNISGKHFGQAGLVDLVKTVLAETNFTPEKLKLEITESAVMVDPEKTISILKELKTLGVHLMIDDFGTGYSSLNYLHKFPIDTLKVDRSFVATMENEEENNEIVNTVILMAKNLHLDVVAEGIETINQFSQLRKLNCEKGQGYFFSRPVPGKQIESLLNQTLPWQDVFVSQEPVYIPVTSDHTKSLVN